MKGDAKFFGNVLRAIRLTAKPSVTKAKIAAAARCRVDFVDAIEHGYSVPGDTTIRAWLKTCHADDRVDGVLDLAKTARKGTKKPRS